MLKSQNHWYYDKSGKARHLTESIGHSKNQGHKRSRFWLGIAEAMADQWTEYLINKSEDNAA